MRPRATAIIIRDNKILLVRDKGKQLFSLPGGGIKYGEPTISACARELYEELGLTATKVTRMRDFDYSGSLSKHKVCLVEAEGEPQITGHELDRFIWWDMKEDIPIFSHVKEILAKL